MLNELNVAIEILKNLITNVSKMDSLTQKDWEYIEHYKNLVEKYESFIKTGDLTDQELNTMRLRCNEGIQTLKEIKNKTKVENIQNQTKDMVVSEPLRIEAEVQSIEKGKKEYQDIYSNSKSEKLKSALKYLGVGALAALITLGITKCSKDNDKQKVTPIEPTKRYEDTTKENKEEPTKQVIEIIDNIYGIDLNNDDEIKQYAEYLKAEFNLEYSVEDIINAIKLANIDRLENKKIFTDTDTLNETTYKVGAIDMIVGSDKLVNKDDIDIYVSEEELASIINKHKNIVVIEYFSEAKTEAGYDIYKLAEICINGYNAKGSHYVGYARVLNELMAQFTLNYSIAYNSPASTFYTLMGEYNVISKELAEASALKLGTIYGTGNNDNRGGDICVEELVKYNTPGNQDNIFYNSQGEIVNRYVSSGRVRN